MILSITLVTFLISLFLQLNNFYGNNYTYSITENEKRKTNIQALSKTWSSTITIGAIGDMLIHDYVYNDAKTNDSYDFKPMLKPFKKELSMPDITLANQETVLGGVAIGLSSYPSFNSPEQVGDALIDAGIDIVSTANNHTLDRGEKAIQNAIQYYERVGLPYVGHFKDENDQHTIRVLEKNGVKVAFLSYTYGTNGIPVPIGKTYLVNIIDLKKIKEEVSRAKKVADVIVMSIHWGIEYERYPTEEQKLLANEIAGYGVDIIFGHHPHVLEPFEWIEKNDKKVFVVYSLGNFLSGQMGHYKDLGGMATIQVTKTENVHGSTIQLSNPKFYPSYVSSNHLHNYQVVPLQDAGLYGLGGANNTYSEIMNHMYQWIK